MAQSLRTEATIPRRRFDTDTSFRLQCLPLLYGNKPSDIEARTEEALRTSQDDGGFGTTLKSLSRDPCDKSQLIATLIFSIKVPLKILISDVKQNKWAIPATDGTAEHWWLDIEFLGFTPLHFGIRDTHNISIIALTGLNGHAFGSFKQKSSSYMWLRDSLPLRLQNAHVYTWGYDSHLLFSDSLQSVEDLGLRFASDLEFVRVDADVGHSISPLVLIGHSLGGLVIKSALLQLSERQSEVNERLLRDLKLIMFFGTPNQGMQIEQLLPMVKDQANEAFVRSLSDFSDGLRVQARLWNRFTQSRDAKRYRFNIVSYYETHVSATAEKIGSEWKMTGPKTQLVNMYSATHGRPFTDFSTDVDALPIDRTHSGLVKFEGPTDTYYRQVCLRIEKCISTPARVPLVHRMRYSYYEYFVGRTREMESISAFFEMNQAGLAVFAICGARGMGKSSLARKFASKCAEKGDGVINLDAQSQDTLEQSACDFLKEDANVMTALIKFLASHRNWILILDNVYSSLDTQKAEHVRALLNTLGTQGHGKVILVTWRSYSSLEILRNRDLSGHIQLQGLDQQSANLLFQKNTSANNSASSSSAHAEDLLKVLGGHPLSITLVANYIAELATSSTSYLTYFQKKLRDSIKHSTQIDASATDQDEALMHGLHVIWQESVKVVQARCPAAIQILGIWSILHVNGFSFDFIRDYDEVEGSPTSIRDIVRDELSGESTFSSAMRDLQNFSLITLSSPNSYSMPEIFHNWCGNSLMPDPDKDMLLSVIECLGRLVPDRKASNYRTQTIKLLPHAQEVSGKFLQKRKLSQVSPVRLAGQLSTPSQVFAFASFAQIFRTHEKLPRGKTILKWAELLQNAIPESHVGKRKAIASLAEDFGNMQKDLGKNDEARENFENALTGYISEYGDDHEVVLDARSNLGSIYTKLTMFSEAEHEFKIVLADPSLSEDDEKRKTDCMQRYAILLSKMDKNKRPDALKQALEYNLRVIKASLSLYQYDKNDHRIPRAAYNLASTYVRLNQLQPAEGLYTRYLPMLEERMVGSSLLFNAQNGYASLLIRLKRYKDAELWLAKAAEGFKQLSGEHSRKYGTVLINIGDLRLAQEDFENAEKQYRYAEDIFGELYMRSRLQRLQRHRDRSWAKTAAE